MTLAGTRPILQDELQKYELHHRARIAIKPGITGMWQVSGRSDITDFEEVVRLDTEYISNWNFGLDIKILLNGILTPVGNDRVFADEIIGLLNNPEKAKRLGKQASELREQLNVKKIAKEWEKLLED